MRLMLITMSDIIVNLPLTICRDSYQRRAYALRRASLAVDRMIRAATPDEKAQAARWVAARCTKAGIHPRPTGGAWPSYLFPGLRA
jgi:hypothetical protein